MTLMNALIVTRRYDALYSGWKFTHPSGYTIERVPERFPGSRYQSHYHNTLQTGASGLEEVVAILAEMTAKGEHAGILHDDQWTVSAWEGSEP